METIQSVIKGGEWMIKEVNAKDIFIPEEFNEEQLMVRDMCNQFIDTEVLPVVERIDKLEPGLMPSLLEKAGAQGLLGITIPEADGGSGKDFVTSVIVAEYLGGGYSFSVANAAHAGMNAEALEVKNEMVISKSDANAKMVIVDVLKLANQDKIDLTITSNGNTEQEAIDNLLDAIKQL